MPANVAAANWAAFKSHMYEFYLKSNETCCYMLTHLEEVARMLRVSHIASLDEFGHFDRYIQSIGLDLTTETNLLMSAHEYTRAEISAIHPGLRMLVDQQLAMQFPNQDPAQLFPVEEVWKTAKYVLESYRFSYVNPTLVYMPYTPQAMLPPYPMQGQQVASALAYGQSPVATGGSIAEMIDALQQASVMSLPLTFYNPYGYSPYGQPIPEMPGQAAASTALQQVALSVKTESMEEKLLAAIQKLADKEGSSSNNRKCGYDGCNTGYRDCTARKADTDSGLIKCDYNK
ncbi:hypothetical protein DFS33DRAFT_1379371 [Desarmillaria ectypa]|nr:hypothetical protein DFS33DRAFT_1379371 [Desarmillaria ectypa]